MRAIVSRRAKGGQGLRPTTAAVSSPSSTLPPHEEGRRKRQLFQLLQELAGHEHALDLVGPFVDLGDLCVAHPLDRVVVHIAVPAGAAARRRS
jgi:hypothetical protein